MKIDGGCHCGHITYEAEVDPAEVIICHCTDCQKLSGRRLPQQLFLPMKAAFRFTGRTAQSLHQDRPERAETGADLSAPNAARRSTPPPWARVPRKLGIRLGTSRISGTSYVPRAQYWQRSAQPWTEDLSAIRQVSEQE